MALENYLSSGEIYLQNIIRELKSQTKACNHDDLEMC